MDRLVLSDAAWERMAPLIIGRPDQKGSTGRDNRMFVEGVLWIVRTELSLARSSRRRLGDWNSVFRRFSRWSLKGIWWRIFAAVSDDPDFEYLIIDSTIVRGASARRGGEKRGSEDQALGRSRGGLSTKIHMAVRGLGCPVRFTLTAGQEGRCAASSGVDRGLPAEVVMADTAYDADPLCQAIAAKGAIAVIPNNPSRALQISARQASLRPAPPGGVLFLKTQAIPSCCNPLRKDRTQLPRCRNARSHHPMDAISVHTT